MVAVERSACSDTSFRGGTTANVLMSPEMLITVRCQVAGAFVCASRSKDETYSASKDLIVLRCGPGNVTLLSIQPKSIGGYLVEAAWAQMGVETRWAIELDKS